MWVFTSTPIHACMNIQTCTHIHTCCDSTVYIEYIAYTLNTQDSPTVEVVVEDGLGLRDSTVEEGSTREVGPTGEGGSTGEREIHAA